MDFDDAEREYRRLEELRQSGELDPERYLAQLHAIRVQDTDGRTWMMQERTGHWFVYDQGQWRPATPPGRAPSTPPPPAPAVAPPTRAQAAPSSVQQAPRVGSSTRAPVRATRRRKPGCMGITFRLLIWALFWVAVAWGVSTLMRATPLWAYAAVAGGALLTLILWLRHMTRFGRAARKGAQGGLP